MQQEFCPPLLVILGNGWMFNQSLVLSSCSCDAAVKEPFSECVSVC